MKNEETTVKAETVEKAKELKLEETRETAEQSSAPNGQSGANAKSTLVPASIEEIVELSKMLDLSDELTMQLYRIFKEAQTEQLRITSEGELQRKVNVLFSALEESNSITIERPGSVLNAIAGLR